MKSVCHITSVHPANDTRIYLKECLSLSAHYDVTLLYCNDAIAISDDMKNSNVRFVRAKKIRNRFFRMMFQPILLLRSALNCEADLYHFHDPELLPLGMMLKCLGKRVIYDVHEDVSKQILSKPYISPLFRPLISKAFHFVEFCFARFLDGIICVSPAVAASFKSRGCRLVTCVFNYPMLSEFSDYKTSWANKEKQVTYLGGITRIRGIHEMCKAAPHTDAAIKVAGPFLENGLETVIKTDYSSTTLQFLGQIDRKAVKQLLETSCAGLILFHAVPNHMDCQPNKIFEYMAAGLPIIAADLPCFKDIIEANEIGFCVDINDAKAIGQYITRLCDDLALSEKMGCKARELVFSTYNWESTFENLTALYDEVFS